MPSERGSIHGICIQFMNTAPYAEQKEWFTGVVYVWILDTGTNRCKTIISLPLIIPHVGSGGHKNKGQRKNVMV